MVVLTSRSRHEKNRLRVCIERGRSNYYIYGPGATPVEQIGVSSGTTSYLLSDELGSIRGITNSSGTVTGSESYDPWGNVTGTSGTISTTLGFAGGYTDTKSGFVYFRARWYDPATGAFTTLDPKVASTLEPYQYVGNDPLNGTDPSGQCGGFFHDLCSAVDAGKKVVKKVAKVTVKVAEKAAPVVAIAAVAIATIPLDETGVGEAIDAEVISTNATEAATASATDEAASVSEANASHIFRDATGHLAEDTPENRQVLEETATNPASYVGTDSNGVATYRQMLPDGTQAWAEVYNGEITNGGVNGVPR